MPPRSRVLGDGKLQVESPPFDSGSWSRSANTSASRGSQTSSRSRQWTTIRKIKETFEPMEPLSASRNLQTFLKSMDIYNFFSACIRQKLKLDEMPICLLHNDSSTYNFPNKRRHVVFENLITWKNCLAPITVNSAMVVIEHFPTRCLWDWSKRKWQTPSHRSTMCFALLHPLSFHQRRFLASAEDD